MRAHLRWLPGLVYGPKALKLSGTDPTALMRFFERTRLTTKEILGGGRRATQKIIRRERVKNV
jgi:hypothetical protein